MHIDMTYLWAGIRVWTVLVIAALAFNYGAHRNRLEEE